MKRNLIKRKHETERGSERENLMKTNNWHKGRWVGTIESADGGVATLGLGVFIGGHRGCICETATTWQLLYTHACTVLKDVNQQRRRRRHRHRCQISLSNCPPIIHDWFHWALPIPIARRIDNAVEVLFNELSRRISSFSYGFTVNLTHGKGHHKPRPTENTTDNPNQKNKNRLKKIKISKIHNLRKNGQFSCNSVMKLWWKNFGIDGVRTRDDESTVNDATKWAAK